MSPESIQSLGHLFSGVFLVRQLLCLLFIPGALDQGDWSAQGSNSLLQCPQGLGRRTREVSGLSKITHVKTVYTWVLEMQGASHVGLGAPGRIWVIPSR